MIVKRNFSPLRVWQYIKTPMRWIIIWVIIIWSFDQWLFTSTNLGINFTPIGVLGSALAIFIAFRNNSAYGRWWEARQIWGGIVNSSRVLARLIITFTDGHQGQSNYDAARSERFKSKMVNYCIAWVHCLRLHLRHQETWEELSPFLIEEDYETLIGKQNKPAYLQLMIGQEIYRAMGNGTLGGFDSFQMEGQLLALANYQGASERIKNTPLPRQYDYFTRVFVMIFSLLLPFGLIGLFQTGGMTEYTWISVPMSIVLSGVFVIMERTGAANEDPFENLITDVPLTTICNTIERDLKEMIGTELPDKLLPQSGYLY